MKTTNINIIQKRTYSFFNTGKTRISETKKYYSNENVIQRIVDNNLTINTKGNREIPFCIILVLKNISILYYVATP